MDTVTALVKEQYTEWPYPEPIPNIAAWKAVGGQLQFDLRRDHNLIWPERAYDPELSILIAGCGTGEAAVEAYNNPKAKIVGIDLSSSSLEHTNQLKKQHNLQNLELRQMDLHDVPSLGRKFDLVICFGVLHHVSDPQKGLTALAEVVKQDGALFITLYGKYLRTGVYMMQDALRRLAVGHTPADIDFVRTIIKSLPSYHPLHTYMRTVEDLAYDSGIVDTFLHSQDRAFSVPEVLALASDADLSFQGWYDNLYYYPDGAMDPHQPLYQKVAALPDEQQWAVVELLVPPVSGHRFILRKKGGRRDQRISFADAGFLNFIPERRQFLKNMQEECGAIKLNRSWHSLELKGLDAELFLATDGDMNISDILDKVAKGCVEGQEIARRFFSRMWRLGHLTMSQRTTKPV